MAKIPRKTQKIFAENAGSLMLTAFGTAMTNNPTYTTDLDVIQNANFQSGWASAITSDKAPYEEDTNGLFYAFTQQIAYILQQGLSIEYDANTTYFKGSIVAVINDATVSFYISMTDNNTGNNVTDGVNWQLHSISKIEDYYNSLLSQINNCVKLSGNQSIGGTKTFTSVAYGKGSNLANSLLTTATALSHDSTGGFRASVKLGNGLIINWGRRTGQGGSSGVVTVNFKTSFSSSTSYCICKNYMSSNRTELYDDESSFYNKTSSSAQTYVYRGDTTQFEYIAIGY